MRTKLAEDVFERVIDRLEFSVTDVAVTKCKLDVHLRFGGFAFGIAQLGNESRGVASLPPTPLQYMRRRSATNDEFDRLTHIARRWEIACLTRRHAGRFRARFDKHPNLENAYRFLRRFPESPFRLFILLLVIGVHVSSPFRPFAVSPIRS